MRLPNLLTALIILSAVALMTATSTAWASANASDASLSNYQRQLVDKLAERDDTRSLLGAALLARNLPAKSGEPAFPALIERAARSDDAGPAVFWVQLLDCDKKARQCPQTQALQKLQQQAPDNAAVWLMALGSARNNGDDAAARHALERAAQASHFDLYAGPSRQALVAATRTRKPPAGLYGDAAIANNPAGLKTLLVFGLDRFQPMPAFQTTAALCAQHAEGDPTRKTCLKLARVLQHGGSPLARSLGLHLTATLSRDADARADTKVRRRDLTWQVHNFRRLTLAARKHADLAHHMLDLAADGGTRMQQMHTALKAMDIPLHAPDDWTPSDGDGNKDTDADQHRN